MKNEITQDIIQEQTDYWRKIGLAFGYPSCCIDSFVDRGIKILKASMETDGLSKVFEVSKETLTEDQKGFYHGFLPCPKCAKTVKPGEEGSLIKNRTFPLPFPQDGDIPEQEKKKLRNGPFV